MKNLLFILFSIALFQACVEQNSKVSQHSEIDERNNLLSAIDSAERILKSANSNIIDSLKGIEMLNAYGMFMDNYPEDKMIPELLFKSGDVARGIGDLWRATKFFNDLHLKFPDHRLAPEALFIQGLCFMDLNQLKYAQASFEDLVLQYPENPLSNDAKSMIEMIQEGEEEYFENHLEE